MFRNYIKIALRIFWQKKVYVAINILSLGFALACCILSYLHYDYRASFDKNHKGTENIYRLNSLYKTDGSAKRWGITPAAVGASMLADNPGVSRIARLHSDNVVVKKGESFFNEKIHFTDKNLFSFFTFPLSSGNFTQFDGRNAAVIGEAFANKYFGTSEATGKQIAIVKDGKEHVFNVTAVIGKVPLNSSFQFDIVTSFNNDLKGEEYLNDWRNAPLISLFAEIKNSKAIQPIAQSLSKYVPIHNGVRDDWKLEGFYFQPFTEIALSSDVDFDEYVQGRDLNPNPRGVMVFVPAIMSVFILLIACFNFTNISIAFASKRLKEIGVRKVMGGSKVQLIKQFLAENILLCLIASALSVLIIMSLLPVFKTYTGVQLEFNWLQNPVLLLFLVLLPLTTAFVAGLYPSFYISSFEPVGILKGQTTFGPKSRFTRFLLFLQFSLSCLALIIGIVLTKNAAYQSQADYGYDIHNVAVTEVSNGQEYAALRNALVQDRRIKSIGGAEQQVAAGTNSIVVASESGEVKAQVANIGGEDYLNTMGIKLLQGRHFYRGEGLDKKSSVLVNQTLAQQLNIQEPVGKQIKVDSSYYTIVGIVADYKEFGLHGKVPPCVLRSANEADFKYLTVNADASSLGEVQSLIKAAWFKAVAGKPYQGFLQQEMIEKERYMNVGFQAVSFFLAAITILFSAAGLFALVSLNIIRRSKEVGMRKVLGASILHLMSLVSKEFFLIILVAFAVGASLGYVIIDKIIFQHIYAYHTEVSVVDFGSALVVLFASCAATVGWRIYGAATANPVNVLR